MRFPGSRDSANSSGSCHFKRSARSAIESTGMSCALFYRYIAMVFFLNVWHRLRRMLWRIQSSLNAFKSLPRLAFCPSDKYSIGPSIHCCWYCGDNPAVFVSFRQHLCSFSLLCCNEQGSRMKDKIKIIFAQQLQISSMTGLWIISFTLLRNILQLYSCVINR